MTLEHMRLRAWKHSSRLGKRADQVVSAMSRVRLAAYVAWLALTVVEPYTNDATMQRRAGFLVRNTLLLFVAAAWLCAGRFA